jgi:inorganic pyrophosphatase
MPFVKAHRYALTMLGVLFALVMPLTAGAQDARPPRVLPASAATALVASLNAAERHATQLWRDTPPFNDDGTVNAYIEIALGDRRKWEFNMAANGRAIDRTLPVSVGGFPVNYGYVPQTVSYDGDPFDALVLGPPLEAGRFVRGIIVGVMFMEDEKGHDSKVVLSPVGAGARPQIELSSNAIREMTDFFNRYKAWQPGAFSRVLGWGSRDEGAAYIETTRRFFRECRKPGTSCAVAP